MTPEVAAARAVRAYAAMQRHFERADGLYRRDGLPRLPRSVAHLWPSVRALVATLDLAGVRARLRGGLDAEAAVSRRLVALERYWDPAGPRPAYASDVAGSRFGGERYYDDNAWVGLALVALERWRPGSGLLGRADELFRFAVSGWDHRSDMPSPGGVFWVEQGRGVGARNHDRNTVSNAPNAQLGLHLAELMGTGRDDERHRAAHAMYAWVNATLDAGADSGSPATGLFWDRVCGDGTIDRTLRTYNQGSMLGANVLLARLAAPAEGALYLGRAETIARRALAHYAGAYVRSPAAFNAILFRNLLSLHAVTADAALRRDILVAMRGYAEAAWTMARDRHDRFRLSGRAFTLLDQSAMVQIYALLAWDPDDYGKLT